jgi:hypothetical protein
MSEAESLNQDTGLPKSDESILPSPPATAFQASESAPQQDLGDEDWQTIDFPGAMRVDAIPEAAEPVCEGSPDADPQVLSALAALSETPSPEVAAVTASASTSVEAITSQSEALATTENFAKRLELLQKENGELRDRIVQLEQDLSQQQIEFQLEVARSLHSTPESPSQPEASEVDHEELAVAQVRVRELLQELEFSKQASQRQRILVETLTEQLDASQERVAQLERDCALAQQRYNEQVQQLLQTENTCRDLRMRLHRQQRQTLQFKAALEKCLEMPPAQRQSHFSPTLNLEDSAPTPAVPVPPASFSQVLMPKNQPVRPWSIASGLQLETDADNSDLPRPLSKLLHPNEPAESEVNAPNTPWVVAQASDVQAASSLMNQIFPDASTASSNQFANTQESNNVFDLSPFLQSETESSVELSSSKQDTQTGSVNQSSNPVQGDDALLKMLAAVPLDSDELGSPLEAFRWRQSDQPEDALWDDLAKLVDPPAVETESAKPVTAEILETGEDSTLSDVPVRSNPSPIDRPTSQPISAISDRAPASEDKPVSSKNHKPLELVTWTPRSTRQARSHLQAVSPSALAQTIQEAPKSSVEATNRPVERVSSPSLNSELLTAGWPSPVVYPLRPSKKLKSLAAVDLPTFPKAR